MLPQVKLDDPTNCLDSMFVFSLVWSVGASCDRASALKFDAFVMQLLAGRVQAAVDRTDFDLGPGLAVQYPEQLYAVNLPEVRCVCVRAGEQSGIHVSVHVRTEVPTESNSAPANTTASALEALRMP